MNNRKIILKKVKVHNLKSIDITLDTNDLIVFTGVSGSGKSSLAFDTIYAEGQRRYVESLSTFARRQLGEMTKPELDHASGISPTISIEQKTAGRNPRSTLCSCWRTALSCQRRKSFASKPGTHHQNGTSPTGKH